jgi:hypothetical protein
VKALLTLEEWDAAEICATSAAEGIDQARVQLSCDRFERLVLSLVLAGVIVGRYKVRKGEPALQGVAPVAEIAPRRSDPLVAPGAPRSPPAPVFTAGRQLTIDEEEKVPEYWIERVKRESANGDTMAVEFEA